MQVRFDYSGIMSGLMPLVHSLPEIFADEIAKSALSAAGRVIAADAKKRVPVKSGDLRDSIVVRRTTRAQKVKSAAAIMRANGFMKKGQGAYSRAAKTLLAAHARDLGVADVVIGFKKPASRRMHLIEFGTAHAKARPFLRPAIDEKAGEANRVARVYIKKHVPKIAAEISGEFAKISRKNKRRLAKAK